MGFPDDRDREIIRKAERTENFATDLAHWVAEYNQDRVAKDLAPVAESDEFELTRLRRLSSNLYSSAKVPVAAAVYGPSQVGKSLFVGRVLVPSSDDYSPLGRDEQLRTRLITKRCRSTTTSIPVQPVRTKRRPSLRASRPKTASRRPRRRNIL